MDEISVIPFDHYQVDASEVAGRVLEIRSSSL